MVRGSGLTGIAMTGRILNRPSTSWQTVPGGLVIPGRPQVFYMAVCAECEDLVVPFDTEVSRDNWALAHPHNVSVGVEVRIAN